jgi:chaperonin GroEL
LKKGIDMAV